MINKINEFNLQNIKPGWWLTLQQSKDDFLILQDFKIVRIRDGHYMARLQQLSTSIDLVRDNKRQPIACWSKNDARLVPFDYFLHDTYYKELKEKNKLLTLDEISILLQREKIYLRVNALRFVKTKSKYLSFPSSPTPKHVQTFYAYQSVKVKQNTYGNERKILNTRYIPLTVAIFKYVIDIKKELYLYKYQLLPDLFI